MMDGRVDRLEAALVALAEAQQRTEARVEELAQAQARTEARVEELAQAQRRTEDRLDALIEVVDKLARAVERLQKQVGGLSDMMGGDIEDVAAGVIYATLRRELGWDVGMLNRSWQTWNGEPEEVDVFGPAIDPTRPSVEIWIVGEAKRNLTKGDVRRFARKAERARRRLTGEVFPVCFCYRARPEVQRAVTEAGLRLVFSYGQLV